MGEKCTRIPAVGLVLARQVLCHLSHTSTPVMCVVMECSECSVKQHTIGAT
jgi:hypothetical protein